VRVRLRDCICSITTDIDVNGRFDAPQTDASVNRCISAVTDCLESPSTGVPELVRLHLAQIFLRLKHGHRAIRELLRLEDKDPMVVSAMPLVRVQVETLYAVCLVVEKPEYLGLYLKDGWKKIYVRHLLMQEECLRLPRVSEGLREVTAGLEGMRIMSGVTETEKKTIELDELGTPFQGERQPIEGFPTPAQVISKVQDSNRRKMLQRLYPEYQFLCGFVHFSPSSSVLSSLLDQTQPYQRQFTSGQREEIFQKEIAGPALWLDQISVVQSCTELYGIYPSHMDLARALSEAWNQLAKGCLVGRALWELRTKKLLNALG
jgi:hypothetical protein